MCNGDNAIVVIAMQIKCLGIFLGSFLPLICCLVRVLGIVRGDFATFVVGF